MTCTKTRYPNKKEALSKLNWTRANPKIDKLPTRAYYCRSCLAWHITHVPHFDEIDAPPPPAVVLSVEIWELDDEALIKMCRSARKKMAKNVSVAIGEVIARYLKLKNEKETGP